MHGRQRCHLCQVREVDGGGIVMQRSSGKGLHYASRQGQTTRHSIALPGNAPRGPVDCQGTTSPGVGGDRQIGVGDSTDTRVFGSDRALSYQQYSPQVRGDVVEGGVSDGDQAGGYFNGVNHFLYERT